MSHGSSISCHMGQISGHCTVSSAVYLVIASSGPALRSSTSREYCQWDTFNASCHSRPHHVIIMTSARYGRMAAGRSVSPVLFPSCMKCQGGLAMRKLSVRPSVRLSVKRMHCDKTEQRSVQFLPRCMQCRRGLAMRILSVRLSVCPSVCQMRAL